MTADATDNGGILIGGEGAQVDSNVQLAYPSGRGSRGQLHLGARARVRSGTVLYADSTIGCDFETGHNVHRA